MKTRWSEKLIESIVIGALLWRALLMLPQADAQEPEPPIFRTGFEKLLWACEPISYFPATGILIARECITTETPEDFRT